MLKTLALATYLLIAVFILQFIRHNFRSVVFFTLRLSQLLILITVLPCLPQARLILRTLVAKHSKIRVLCLVFLSLHKSISPNAN